MIGKNITISSQVTGGAVVLPHFNEDRNEQWEVNIVHVIRPKHGSELAVIYDGHEENLLSMDECILLEPVEIPDFIEASWVENYGGYLSATIFSEEAFEKAEHVPEKIKNRNKDD